MKHKALFFTSFALHLIYTYLRTKFSPSLAHCIVLKHDQASQSVPALPKFYRKCEKGVIMAATYRLFFTNEKAFFLYIQIFHLPCGFFNVNRLCNRQGNLSANAWLFYLTMSLVQTKRHCNLSLHSILPNVILYSNYTGYTTVIFFFCVHIILLHLIYSLLNIRPTKLMLSVLVLTLYII